MWREWGSYLSTSNQSQEDVVGQRKNVFSLGDGAGCSAAEVLALGFDEIKNSNDLRNATKMLWRLLRFNLHIYDKYLHIYDKFLSDLHILSSSGDRNKATFNFESDDSDDGDIHYMKIIYKWFLKDEGTLMRKVIESEEDPVQIHEMAIAKGLDMEPPLFVIQTFDNDTFDFYQESFKLFLQDERVLLSQRNNQGLSLLEIDLLYLDDRWRELIRDAEKLRLQWAKEKVKVLLELTVPPLDKDTLDADMLSTYLLPYVADILSPIDELGGGSLE
eukprot:gene90-120_t